MNRRTFLKTTGLAAAAAAVPALAAPAKTKPNVIVILTDDAGHADFGCYGCRDIPTPNIDRLAADGVRFTQGYVSASVCCPSRAGLLTGRYQQRFGHEFNGPGWPEAGYAKKDMGLAIDEKTIGDVMKAAGYRTACLGKWHMGTQERFFPLRRGFDEFFGLKGGSRSYWPIKGRVGEGHKMWRGEKATPEETLTYLTDDLTTAAVDFIGQHRERPFFLYLSYTAVHAPMHGKKEDLSVFQNMADMKRRTYAAMMKALDDGVAKVRAALAEHKLAEQTLIVFINDNGGATGNGSDNGPLRGMKGSKWEGGIRVPFMMTWPGRLPKGTTFDAPVISLDILPTALAAAGGTWTGKKPLDGVDLLPYASGRKKGTPHEVLFWRRGVAAACRKGDWKLIRVQGNPDLLFDLAKDPGEKTNLAGKHPDKVKDLKVALAAWETGLAPPRWREGKVWERNQVMKHRMDVIGRAMERKYP